MWPGDAAGGTATVVHAMAQGKSTARQALNDLYQLGLKEENQRVSQRDFPALGDALPVVPRAVMPEHPPAQRVNGYDEVALGLSKEQVINEADRCLQCGVCSECMACVEACSAIKGH